MTAKYERFAETYLTIALRGTTEWMCNCPFHDDKGASLQFNVEKGLWVCFGCQQGGSAKSMARRLDVSFEDPVMPASELRARLERAVSREVKEVETLPESYLRRFTIERHPAWYKRGFNDETLDYWNLGYDFLRDELTIPYRTPDGDLLGVIRRRLSNEFPRYLYPKGFDRAGSLFGSWIHPRKVALVEGTLDAIKTWQNGIPAMAIYGSSMTTRQVTLLRKIGVRDVVLFFDYDDAGIRATRQVQDVLDGFIVSRVAWDEEIYCPAKACTCSRQHRPDPGMLTEPEFQNVISRTVMCGTTRRTP